MIYRVTFRKRFRGDGQESAIEPEQFVWAPDGVVVEAAMSEQIDPPARHNQEVLDEDDNFESIGTEVWEYEIADGREEEFITALEASGEVIDYEKIEEIVG